MSWQTSVVGQPSFGYASSGGLDIAYIVYGDGPVDVVVVTGLIGHIGMNEELPWYREVVERVPAFARLIMLDKRGEGLSTGRERSRSMRRGSTTSGP